MWAKYTLDLLEINPIFQVACHPHKYTRKLGIHFQPTVTNAYAIYDVVSVCVLWLKCVLYGYRKLSEEANRKWPMQNRIYVA